MMLVRPLCDTYDTDLNFRVIDLNMCYRPGCNMLHLIYYTDFRWSVAMDLCRCDANVHVSTDILGY